MTIVRLSPRRFRNGPSKVVTLTPVQQAALRSRMRPDALGQMVMSSYVPAVTRHALERAGLLTDGLYATPLGLALHNLLRSEHVAAAGAKNEAAASTATERDA